MTKITGLRPQVGSIKERYYRVSAPNIKSLCDKAITGKIEQGDLNHLVVYLETKPKAFSFSESGNIAQFIFLPVMEDVHPEGMKETARFGLELLAAEGRPGHWTAKEIIEKLDKAEPTKPAPGPIAPPPMVTPRPLAAKPAPVPSPLPVRPVAPPLPKPVQVAPAREVPLPTKPVTPAVAPATIREPLKPERASDNSSHQAAMQQADELIASILDPHKEDEFFPHLRPVAPPLPKPVQVVPAREVPPPTKPVTPPPLSNPASMAPVRVVPQQIEPAKGSAASTNYRILRELLLAIQGRPQDSSLQSDLEFLRACASAGSTLIAMIHKESEKGRILSSELLDAYERVFTVDQGLNTSHRKLLAPLLREVASVEPFEPPLGEKIADLGADVIVTTSEEIIPAPGRFVKSEWHVIKVQKPGFKSIGRGEVLRRPEVVSGRRSSSGSATPPTNPVISIKIGGETLFFSEVTYYAGHGGSKKIKTGILAEDCVLLNLRKGMEVEFDQLGLFSAELSRPARFGTIDLPAGTRVAIFTDGKLYQATLKQPQIFYGIEYPAETPIWFDHDQQYARAIRIVEKDGKTIGREHFSESMAIHFLASGKIEMVHYHGSQYEFEPLPVAVNIWGRTFELRNAYVYFNEAREKESIELIEGQKLFGCSLPARTIIIKEKTGQIIAQLPDGTQRILT
ncbi:MAG: hypothetical protein WCW67_05505 [Candidatus Margulisiibacteriota bacterium]|jgi:hypothetical protein